uniref:AB hydrolase-1 domain-containing protein n=1 Tax=Alexandrium monilatum TaxID=311494 RepID=A0A7S4UU00_9DINO
MARACHLALLAAPFLLGGSHALSSLHALSSGVLEASALKQSSNKSWVSPIAGCQGFDCVLQYVALPDDAFSWVDTKVRVHGQVGGNEHGLTDVACTGYVLNMTSQQWLTRELINFPVWWHILVVIVPDRLEFPDWATLMLDFGIHHPGGNLTHITNRESLDTVTPWSGISIDGDHLTERLPNLTQALYNPAVLAARTRAPVVLLLDVPNGGEVFADDPVKMDRFQDYTKGFSYTDFLEHPEEPERIMELPNVKAAVRAMDVAQAFTATLPSGRVNQFCMVGYSKLATTTYLTAAADARVKAMAPIAIYFALLPSEVVPAGDAPPGDVEKARTARWIRTLFRPKEMMDAYSPVIASASTPEIKTLMSIVDPGQMVERFTLPKFLATGSADTTVNSGEMSKYVPRLPGTTAYLQVPNGWHEEVMDKSLDAIAAFFRGFLLGMTPPVVKSSWEPSTRTIGATLEGETGVVPLAVRRWDCLHPNQKGLKLDRSVDLPGPSQGNLTWSSVAPARDDEQRGLSSFIELEFEWPEPGHRFRVSTMMYPA